MSEVVSVPVNRKWLAQLLSGQPHQVVGPADRPYLLRWFIIPRNLLGTCNLYLHRFVRSDEPDALHTHPWAFASCVLAGSYVEVTDDGRRVRRAGSVALRGASFRHRIELPEAAPGQPSRACWTIVLTGPKIQEWGFWCSPSHFIPWNQFDGGCGEDQS